jgi:hypothetical protein
VNIINENLKNDYYDLRIENIGIRPGNAFKGIIH